MGCSYEIASAFCGDYTASTSNTYATREAYVNPTVEEIGTELRFEVPGVDFSNLTEARLELTIAAIYQTVPDPGGDHPSPRLYGALTDTAIATDVTTLASHYTSFTSAPRWQVTLLHPITENAGVGGVIAFDILTQLNTQGISNGVTSLSFLVMQSDTAGGKSGIRFTNPRLVFSAEGLPTVHRLPQYMPLVANFGTTPVICDDNGICIYFYATSPEGVVMADTGSICLTPDNLYRKTTLATNTGWVVV